MIQESSLAEDLASPKEQDSKMVCGLTKVRNQMTEDEAVALDRAIAMIREDEGSGRSKVYSARWLTGVLRKYKYDISESTVSRHVAKRCRCD